MDVIFKRTLDDVNWVALAELFDRASLGAPRPENLERAYRNSALKVFAYVDGELIGAARAITDGVYHAELCDTLVAPEWQGQGIGRRMVELLLEDLRGIKVLLTASFGKEDFYRKLGFRRHKTALACNYGDWWYAD